MGLSFLVPRMRTVTVTVVGETTHAEIEGADGKPMSVWQRRPRVTLCRSPGPELLSCTMPGSGGLQLHVVERPISAEDLEEHIPQGTRSVSVFLLTHRTSVVPRRGEPDVAYAFQAEIEVAATAPSSRGPTCAAHRPPIGTSRSRICTMPTRPSTRPATASRPTGRSWMARAACSARLGFRAPRSRKRRPPTSPGVELSMDALGALADGAAADAALRPLVAQYRGWIEAQRVTSRALPGRGARRQRSCCGSRVLPPIGSSGASPCSRRTPTRSTLSAWPTAPWPARCASGSGSRRRAGTPSSLRSSLLNLPGLADPATRNRETVDLLFFPTGGGKTEAYLGLAAFAMVLRRLRHPGERGPRARA